MFYRKNDTGYRTLVDGIHMKPLVHGELTRLCEFSLEGGKELPVHRHPFEQTGYVVRGRIKMIVGEESFEAGPGDSWCIPKDVLHGAEVPEDTVIVEVFSPVREEYLA